MRQIYYTFRYLLRGLGDNVIKVISLTLGLGVGLLLFARVAFEMSFDTFFDRVDDLYVIDTRYVVNGDDLGSEPIINAPMPEAMRMEFPEIEASTVCRRGYGFSLFHGNDKFRPRTVMADSLFFRTLGVKVLRGDDRSLGVRDQLFLSEKMAFRIFGKEDPVGKQLMYGKYYPYTVAGVFEDIPANSHLRFDAVASFGNVKTQFGYYAGWDADDSYTGYIRLKPGTDPLSVDRKIPALVAKYRDTEKEKSQGEIVSYRLKPVSEVYTNSPEVRRMVIIMSALAFALLFVAAMNYVLNSVSSLPVRARSVGVHKCNGASSGEIFQMFIFETAALFVTALVFLSLLLFACREHVAEITAVPSLGALLNSETLWLPLVMLLIIFSLSALLPARLFSEIPVTHVFRVSTTGKQVWKRSLLFVQFGGITFVITLLAIVLLQYDWLMNKDLGFNPDNVVYASFHDLNKEKKAKLTAEFKKLSYVSEVGCCNMGITSGYGGFPIMDDQGNKLFSARSAVYDGTYLPLMNIQLAAGRNLKEEGDIVVNETFIHKRGWKDSPVGKPIYDEGALKGHIVGVMKDYLVSSLYSPQSPVIVFCEDSLTYGQFTVRVAGLTSERLREMNEKIARLFPREDVGFSVLKEDIEDQYEGTRHFRDGVILASVAILLITLMGLIGYINDEIHRRSKEIAMRKVNGATTEDILRLLSKDILLTAFPAVLLGLIGSRIVGEGWLRQFADKIPLSIFIFLATSFLVLGIIWSCVLVRSWNVASDDPVNRIKSE